ncbi:MAPEG family protein [Synechococcus sp. J7-Johnson]|uniref:MAPEG family protein n=1 Tax=Synechococcus sp. J7-Johnson TaxID=2823737 RepID=UPI0020CDB6EF|nr:MAPEG family protein [Synechococcus sp. J7-Johnson]MCP9840395.1 MAPEG family protein [Synechococcus sp. J7-Johnson]
MTIAPLPGLITLLAVITFQATAMQVGRARIRHGVKPPLMSGPPAFERAMRVQQNTLEQIVVFLPAFWLAVLLSNATAASVLGAVWVLGRVLYAVGYLRAPEQRGLGFAISFIATTVLLVMALVGSVMRLL